MTNNFFSLESTAQEILETVRRSKYYYFGVLTSSVHMAWTRAVCERLKSDYRYSKDIVYNNFVWCKPTAEQAAAICETAKKILQVRAGHAGKTLAYLYGAEMPEDLKAAHRANDLAVLAAYGFGESWSDSEIVAELFKMYRQLSKS